MYGNFISEVLLQGFLKECRKGGTAELKTYIVCSEDDQNLYFEFDGEQRAPFHKHNEYNAPLYEGDIFEVLLTLESQNRYLEIETNGNNAQYCVIIENKDGEGDIIIDKLDECIFSSTTLIQSDRWQAKITLPKEKLKKLGWKKEECRINLHRQDFDSEGNLNLYSYFPTFSGSFHKIKSFKRLYN